MIHAPDIAYALLRVNLAVVFLFSGIGKLLKGPGAFATGLQEQFAGTWLLPERVAFFGGLLPHLEVGLGALLVLGLFNLFVLILTGALVLARAFGAVVESKPPTVASILFYALDFFRPGRLRR